MDKTFCGIAILCKPEHNKKLDEPIYFKLLFKTILLKPEHDLKALGEILVIELGITSLQPHKGSYVLDLKPLNC
jgi:hypothetical protein